MTPIVMDALMVQAPDGYVRFILGDYCLDFPASDVLEVADIAPPESLIAGSALPVRVTLKAGAALQRLASSEPYTPLLWSRRQPFAFASRPDLLCSPDDEVQLLEKEVAYYRARGLHQFIK